MRDPVIADDSVDSVVKADLVAAVGAFDPGVSAGTLAQAERTTTLNRVTIRRLKVRTATRGLFMSGAPMGRRP
jgi:hypothetical protein